MKQQRFTRAGRTFIHSEVPRQPDKPLEKRIADLAAICAEDLVGPVEERWAQVVCDGCGLIVRLDDGQVELPAGWIANADGDYCPGCVAGAEAEEAE